jgi:carotenoid cleavage dioxygenase-like enzyme
MPVRGIRGATTATANTKEAILEATREMLELLIEANDVDPDEVASAYFTTTADLNVEFPGFDAARTGRKTKWGYFVDHDPKILRWTGLRKYNTDTGENVGAWSDNQESCWYSEPWFAPADDQRSEDHGYVITFVWNDSSREQQLQVFDALDLSRGPITRVRLPQRVPPGFHACFMKPRQIASWG